MCSTDDDYDGIFFFIIVAGAKDDFYCLCVLRGNFRDSLAFSLMGFNYGKCCGFGGGAASCWSRIEQKQTFSVLNFHHVMRWKAHNRINFRGAEQHECENDIGAVVVVKVFRCHGSM